MIPTYQEIRQPDLTMRICLDAYNKRVRVDELEGDPAAGHRHLLEHTPAWAEKIILKARRGHLDYFTGQGWVQEAAIPGYFRGEDLFFLVFYPQTTRGCSDQVVAEQAIVQKILGLERKPVGPSHQAIRQSTAADAEKLAALYKAVFAVYPTPLGDPAYIAKTMEGGTVYVHIEHEGRIVSAASAEVNHKFANAEMTDCATLEGQEGRGYMALLLARLEQLLRREGITCLYTICRAQSFGMNKVFYNLGYHFSGCLVNNCHIYSGLENMNVWYKKST